jgi:hypothetical protein
MFWLLAPAAILVGKAIYDAVGDDDDDDGPSHSELIRREVEKEKDKARELLVRDTKEQISAVIGMHYETISIVGSHSQNMNINLSDVENFLKASLSNNTTPNELLENLRILLPDINFTPAYLKAEREMYKVNQEIKDIKALQSEFNI